MFDRARLRLAVWYAATSFMVLLVLGLAAFGVLTSGLDRQVDEGVESVVSQWLAAGADPGSLPPLILEPGPPVDPDDTFLLVFRADGQLVVDPLGTAPDPFVPLIAATGAGGAGEGRAYRTLIVGGTRLRVVSAPIVIGGRPVGTVVAGRSLAQRDAQVARLSAVLAAVAGAGLFVSAAAGYLLAGRALSPLAESHERQRQFVADASHELRSPIAVIRTAADVIMDEPLTDAQRAAVETIRDVADEVGRLVAELLELARLDAPPADGAPPPPLDLAIPVHEELARLRTSLEVHDTAIAEALEPAFAPVPTVAVQRIVRVLIDNVLAHTPVGTPAGVRTMTMAGRALLIVEDSGPGVAAGQHEHLFERFTRLNEARTPGPSQGAGLGLAIARAVAQAWDGHVAAAPAPGGGLRVTVSFPAAPRV